VQYKKNKFLIFFIVNIFLLLIVLLLSIPAFKFLSKINLDDNEFVEGQTIINPKAISPTIIDRTMTINFVAKVDNSLEWKFKPLQDTIDVKIGENKIIEYEGKNLSNRTITSTANFIAEPEAFQAYLVKTECFCFTEQTLKSGESKIFTMVFYIDPSLDSDWYFDDLKELVFTYEFSEYKS
jgi:cytochrome c oxidase assembly protein subunit 11